MFYIRFSALIHLMSESLYPFPNLSLSPHSSAPGNRHLLSISTSLTFLYPFDLLFYTYSSVVVESERAKDRVMETPCCTCWVLLLTPFLGLEEGGQLPAHTPAQWWIRFILSMRTMPGLPAPHTARHGACSRRQEGTFVLSSHRLTAAKSPWAVSEGISLLPC